MSTALSGHPGYEPRSVAGPTSVDDPCLCGHGRDAHDHFRAGSDCGACGATDCGKYRSVDRRTGGALGRVRRRLARG